MFVYIIVNDVNDKIYVGKTIEKRLEHYWSRQKKDILAGCQGKPHLYNAVRKHGWDRFHIYPLISSLVTNEDICFWERVLIAEYDSQNPDVGYNICRGGEGRSAPNSEVWKQKMRVIMKAKWKMVEYRERVVRSMKETPKTPEQLDNLKAAQLPSTRAKVAATKKLRGQSERQREHWLEIMHRGHHGLPKGFRHSEKSKLKMSKSKAGRVPWNKGKTGFHPTEETRLKISLTMKERGIRPIC